MKLAKPVSSILNLSFITSLMASLFFQSALLMELRPTSGMPSFPAPILSQEPKKLSDDMYFCMAADEGFFDFLTHLIGSIHKVNFDEVTEIAIFDLGFNPTQRAFLESIAKVKVYDVELTHPDLLKHFKIRSFGKSARGWYSWKPVAIKQALDMFPYVLYLDAGCTVLKPLQDVFKYIQEHGHFFVRHPEWAPRFNKKMGGPQSFIGNRCTSFVIDQLELKTPENQWILKELELAANIQGLHKDLYTSYVYPLYELSKDIRYFEADSTIKGGWSNGSHDQLLFSVFALKFGLDFIDPYKVIELMADGKSFDVQISPRSEDAATSTIFMHCKGQMEFAEHIRFKNT